MTKSNSLFLSTIELSYRTLYGKLFSALFSQFGVKYVNQIEDAIQNSFYKSLKSWKPNQIPENKENWLYIVARNDLINQIKKESSVLTSMYLTSISTQQDEVLQEDLRLKSLLLFASIENISSQAKIIFILKNIFGLHIKEISECTLMSQEAIYKSINRTKKAFLSSFKNKSFDLKGNEISYITIVEEILYAVFSTGFDSFNEKIDSIVNDDLCLESLALAKIILMKFEKTSTQNLIALFCFHLARIPGKLTDNRFVPFFKQETKKWNDEFIKLGFHFLKKPNNPNKYYIEALITSKHMTTSAFDFTYWNEIIHLYDLLNTITDSPIVKINWCYCLHKVNRTDEAIGILENIEKQLPKDHFYFSLVKADILKESYSTESDKIINKMLNKVSQKIRKNYISENMMLTF